MRTNKRTRRLVLWLAATAGLAAVVITWLLLVVRPETAPDITPVTTVAIPAAPSTEPARPVAVVPVPSLTTPAPAETSAAASSLKLPKANTEWLDDSDKLTMFDLLVIPISYNWDGKMSGDPSEQVIQYSDKTTCTADTASCPSITFSVTELAESDKELKRWAKADCTFGKAQKMEGPAAFRIDGVPAEFYRVYCDEGGDEEMIPRYAVRVPDKSLLVITTEGSAGAFSVENFLGAFREATWK